MIAGFPAGTVSGAPKIRAMQIIDELEPDRRGVYSGAIGYISAAGDLDTCIALRTAQVCDGQLHIQAGAGIVYDSDPQAEFEETQNKAMALRASSRVEVALRRDFHYAFEERRHGGVPNVVIHPVRDEQPFEEGHMTWTPIPVTHGELPIHGFRVDNVAYITDASAISEDSMTLLEGLEVLVLNALRPNPHYSHFSLPEALEVAQKVNADQTYFTHLSHLMGTHDEVEGKLPGGVHLAHDGLVLTRTSSGTWHWEIH